MYITPETENHNYHNYDQSFSIQNLNTSLARSTSVEECTQVLAERLVRYMNDV